MLFSTQSSNQDTRTDNGTRGSRVSCRRPCSAALHFQHQRFETFSHPRTEDTNYRNNSSGLNCHYKHSTEDIWVLPPIVPYSPAPYLQTSDTLQESRKSSTENLSSLCLLPFPFSVSHTYRPAQCSLLKAPQARTLIPAWSPSPPPLHPVTFPPSALQSPTPHSTTGTHRTYCSECCSRPPNYLPCLCSH